MSGVRIRPQPERLPPESAYGRLIIVRDVTRPLPPNKDRGVCRLCGRPHDCKTYHLQLDGDGTTLVSETIWAQLQKLYDRGGFELCNEVKEPPTQSIVVPTARVTIRPADF